MITENYNQKIESDKLLKDLIIFVNELAKGGNAEIKFPFDEYQSKEHDILTVCHNFNQKYFEKLSSFPEDTIERVNNYMCQIVNCKKNGNIQFDLVSDVSRVIKMIEEAFNLEFTGYPGLAFESIEEAMCANNCHLLNLLPQLTTKCNSIFYRA